MVINSSDREAVPFVVIFQGRCGSTYLMEALNQHPQIHCQMEYFSALKKKKASAEDQLIWLEKFYTSPPVPCLSVGFKTKLSDVMDLDGFSRTLHITNAHIIHLQRHNIVKMTISFFNSVRLEKITGDWNLYDRKQHLPPIIINSNDFDSWLVAIEKNAVDQKEFISRLDLPVLDCYYEDLINNKNMMIRRIMEYLNVAYRPVKGMAVKATSDDLRKSIENFNELRERYAGTIYEAMFDDGTANT